MEKILMELGDIKRCPIFSAKAKSMMKQAVDVGGIEFGSYIDRGPKLDLAYLCIGDSCSVHVQAPYGGDEKLYERGAFGIFHTHPGVGVLEPSAEDFVIAARNHHYGLCIGGKDIYTGKKKMKCRFTEDWPEMGYGAALKKPKLVETTRWPSVAEREATGVSGKQVDVVEREVESPFGKCHRAANIYEWTLRQPDLYGPPISEIDYETDAMARIVEAENRLKEKCYEGYPVVCDYDLE